VKKLFQYNQDTPLHLGTLSRKNALLCLRMKSQLDELIKEACNTDLNDTSHTDADKPCLVLAISGGLDSISMLAMFISLQKKYPMSLHVAHLNHGIRVESDEEKKTLESFCKKFCITFHHEKVDIPHFAQISQMGLEEAARLKRYEFLEKVRSKANAHYICTAHHADDLAEDVLMRLCRGAAWPALGGMKALCTRRKLLRPLLQESKIELIRFAHELNLPFATDKSNEDLHFFRNRVRKTMLPFFFSENLNFLNSIKHLHSCAKRDTVFFQAHIAEFWKTVKIEDEKIIIHLENLKNTQEAMRFRIYIHALSLLKKTYTQHETLEQLDDAVMQNKGNTIFKFTHGARAKIFQNTLIFY